MFELRTTKVPGRTATAQEAAHGFGRCVACPTALTEDGRELLVETARRFKTKEDARDDARLRLLEKLVEEA